MSKLNKRALTAMIGVVACMVPLSVWAEFETTDQPLFEGYFELAKPPEEGTQFAPTEYRVYAIIEETGEFPNTLYMIVSRYKGNDSPMGAFRCNLEFTPMGVFTNGMQDILCVQKSNTFGEVRDTVLRMGEHGLYEQDFGY